MQFGGVWTAVIVAQVAVTVAFPGIALVEVSELQRVRTYDVGFAADEYLAVQLEMEATPGVDVDGDTAAAAAQRARFGMLVETLRQRVAAEPGVAGVTFVDRLPRANYYDYEIVLDDAATVSVSAGGRRVSCRPASAPHPGPRQPEEHLRGDRHGRAAMANVSRRAFIHGAGAVAAALAVPGCDRLTPQAEARRATYAFFTPEEAAFIEPAVARLIPADELGPGALEAGVPTYMDRQLAGAWGAGAGLYRGGPWRVGQPGQGYQLPFTPAELVRKALRAIRDDLARTAPDGFGALAVAEQDAYLRALEAGGRDLGGVPSDTFFGTLLGLTVEGFFSDPVYGGNRDMVGWKLVGFPGAYANYYEFVDQHGVAFLGPPVSLGQDARGSIHQVPAPVAGEEG